MPVCPQKADGRRNSFYTGAFCGCGAEVGGQACAGGIAGDEEEAGTRRMRMVW